MVNGKKVLIVDDSPGNADLLAFHFKPHGFDIVCAGDGHEALAVARTSKPDLIILDVMLPKMNGLEVCRLLKYDILHRDINIYIWSAREDEEIKQLVQEVGADAHFIKPRDLEKLLAAAKSLLGV